MRRCFLTLCLFLAVAVVFFATLNLVSKLMPSVSARKNRMAGASSKPTIKRNHSDTCYEWTTPEGRRMTCICCEFGCKRKRPFDDGEAATKACKKKAKPKQKKGQFCRTPSTATAGQCPCIKKKGRWFCAAYNPAYFAATIEEAIFNFKDTTNPNPDEAITLKPDPKALPKKKLELCPGRDSQCKKCVKYLFDKFLRAAMDISDQELRNRTLEDLTSMLRNAGVPPYTEGECPSLHVGEDHASPPLPPDPFGIAECIGGPKYPTPRGSLPDGTSTSGHNANQNMWAGFSGPSVQPGGQARHKRQSESKDIVRMLKVTTVKRGTPVVNGSTYFGLCDIHWKIGFLRKGLFPRYVNLMTCDEDTSCLSGWGTCRERNRSFQVLEKTSRGYEHEPYSVNAPMACDCQVDVGSAMHSFVQN